MPTEEENTQYLYLVLTNAGNPTVSLPAPIIFPPSLSYILAPSFPTSFPYFSMMISRLIYVQIDWDAVGKAMELSKAAVSKRWSRLKQAVQKGESPSGSSYQFLWLCVKHSSRDKVNFGSLSFNPLFFRTII